MKVNTDRLVSIRCTGNVKRYAAINANKQQAAAGEAIVGVAQSDSTLSPNILVAVNDTSIMVAGAAITQLQQVQVGANGTVVPAAGGAVIGRALASVSNGQQVEVLLETVNPSPVSGPWNFPRARPIRIVSVGNSIADYAKFYKPGTTGRSGWQSGSHHLYLAEKLGLVFDYCAGITATTRVDSVGNYGYPGASLGTINADIIASWFTVLDAAGYVPDIVLALAMTENDTGGGIDPAVTRQQIDLFRRIVGQKWPGAKIVWCTNRPDNRLSQSTYSAAADQVRSYAISLDDGRQFIVADISRANSLGDTWNIDPAGCRDAVTSIFGVHPNATGARREAAVIADRIRTAMNPRPFAARVLSGNSSLLGSIASSPGCFSGGTQPSNTALLNGTTGSSGGTTGWSTTPGDCTTTAENPGWLIKGTVTGAPSSFICRTPAITPVSNVQRKLTPYAKVQIVSGGANIRCIASSVQVVYSGAAYSYDFATSSSPDGTAPPVYADGEIITLFAPLLSPQTAVFGGSGTITSITPDVMVDLQAGTSATWRILECGVIPTTAPPTDVFAGA